jgi:4-hydroxyphenylpyruvate dioxygenase
LRTRTITEAGLLRVKEVVDVLLVEDVNIRSTITTTTTNTTLTTNTTKMETQTLDKKPRSTDFLPLNGTDYVEFYVGNAKQAAHFYKTAFGFQSLAYAGPETGVRDRASYVLKQDKIRLVLTSPLHSDHPISEHLKKHGDGVKVLALWVDDAYDAFEQTTSRGAVPYQQPQTLSDEYGEVKTSGIKLYGETAHIFVERKNYKGIFLPGYKEWKSDYNPEPTGLLYVDHCVGNVGWHKMNDWVSFYEDVMGFKNILTFDDKMISTEYSALMSKVMSNGNGYVKFPINEPAEGKKKSQIEEYLEFYEDEGVQHLALATGNIVETVTELQNRGIEFLSVPTTYYDELLDRVGHIDEDLEPLKKLGILVDRDDEGYLLQIFTKPLEDRPTVFFEIIQRKGARSFGAGNFKALFEAIEHEQELRGNL